MENEELVNKAVEALNYYSQVEDGKSNALGTVTTTSNGSLGSYFPYNEGCPNCGYCKHCGRSNGFPSYTPPTYTPYSTPFPNTVYCSSSNAGNVVGGSCAKATY